MSEQLTKDTLQLEHASEIEGLQFRHGLGEEDFVAMHRVIEISKAADGIEEHDNLEEYVHYYKTLDRFDPARDLLIAEVDGEVIAFNRVNQQDAVDGSRVYFIHGGMVPSWRRKGIGTVMLQAAEERSQALAAEASDHQVQYLESFAADVEMGKIALFENSGYEEIRYFFEMVRADLKNIPKAPLPEKLKIRPVEEKHIRPIWEAMDEAFHDHWGHVEMTEAQFEAWRTEPNQDRSQWCVAWDGDEIAGMVLCFIDREENEKFDRKRGYTEDISVRRPWRRKGLATSLIAESLRNLKQAGMEQAALGVDTENLSGALGLYERLGYQPTRKYIVYRKPLTIDGS